ncbi:MAG: hypothetical protein ABIR37_02350 [Candidatus Saccharimonadales bacterium]
MRNPQETSSHITRRQRVTGSIAIAALTAAGTSLMLHDKHEQDKSVSHERIEALNGAHSILNKVIILKSGTQLRTTPETLSGTPENGEPNNIDHIVPDGKVMVVRMPEMDEEHHPGWIAVAEPDADFTTFKTLDERAAHTLWANYAALTEQDMVSETAYQSVSGEIVLQFTGNPLGKTPNDATYASSIEVDQEAAGIAQFIVTGTR